MWQQHADINQKGNLKKGPTVQPARCVTTPKGCRTANSQECRYLEKTVSLSVVSSFHMDIPKSRVHECITRYHCSVGLIQLQYKLYHIVYYNIVLI